MTTIIDWTPYFEDADALIAPYSQGSYFVFACAYLLYYDYFLTIEAEVRLMWSRGFSLATAMFLYIRYASLLQVALDVLANVSITSTSKIQLTDDSCEVMKYLTTGVACANFMVVSAFVALRLTALYSRNWGLGGILFILGLLNPVFLEGCIVFGFVGIAAPWPYPPCLIMGYGILGTLGVYAPIVSSALSIAYELLCFGLTAYKTYGTYRQGVEFGGMRPSFAWLLLRDGSLYFAAMMMPGAYEMLSATVVHLPVGGGKKIGKVLVPILTTRFISHIRQCNSHNGSVRTLPDVDSTVQFNVAAASSQPASHGRFLESLGGELQLDDLSLSGDGDVDGVA